MKAKKNTRKTRGNGFFKAIMDLKKRFENEAITASMYRQLREREIAA